MALLDRMADVREVRRSADPVTMEEFGYLVGQASGNVYQTKAGASIGPKRALGITAWYSGVRFIAEGIAGLPVHTFRDTGGVRSRRTDPAWLKKPDVELPWFALVESWMMGLLHKGNAFSFKLRNPLGQVVGLRELHCDRITVGQAPDGTKRFLVDRDPTPYSRRDVFHIPGLAYDGRVGLNPVQYAADALGAVAATDDYAQRFFANGTHIGGLISIAGNLRDGDGERLRAEWDQFHAGLTHAHKTGVLSNGATYQRVSLSAEDTQLIESRQYGVTEVARLLRLPPPKLYDLTHATFSNIEQQTIDAVTDGLQPWVERIEAFVNSDPDLLPAGNFIEFSLEGRLRGDSQSRSQFYTSAVGAPWMTPNEARRYENLPSVDGGDELLTPLNMGQSATQMNGGGQNGAAAA